MATTTGTGPIAARREARARRRRTTVIVAVAALALAGTVLAAVLVGLAVRPPPHERFRADNTEQQVGYQVSYDTTMESLREGRSARFIEDVCRMTASMGSTDMAIGTLGGCSDALYDFDE